MVSKKKKKKVFTKIGSDFSAGFVRFRLVGGDVSLTGAELFEIEADFSAKIVTFRLVGGMHPPHPPPKSATAREARIRTAVRQMSSHGLWLRGKPWQISFNCKQSFKKHILMMVYDAPKLLCFTLYNILLKVSSKHLFTLGFQFHCKV